MGSPVNLKTGRNVWHTSKKHVNTAWLRKYSIVNLKDHRKFFAVLLGKINYNGLAIRKLKKIKRNNKFML